MKKKALTVNAWGPSLGIRLPKEMAEDLEITNGTKLFYEVQNGQIILSKQDAPRTKRDNLDEGILTLAKALPKDSNIRVIVEDGR